MVINMDISIKDSIIDNSKGESLENIIKLIDEGSKDKDELVLPGLGVILSLFWPDLSTKEKEEIAKIVQEKVK